MRCIASNERGAAKNEERQNKRQAVCLLHRACHRVFFMKIAELLELFSAASYIYRDIFFKPKSCKRREFWAQNDDKSGEENPCRFLT